MKRCLPYFLRHLDVRLVRQFAQDHHALVVVPAFVFVGMDVPDGFPQLVAFTLGHSFPIIAARTGTSLLVLV